MHAATLLLVILAAGLGSQWLAWRLGLPAIIVLIATGLLLGPATGIVQIGLSQTELTELIGLGVAIVLFEGGMDLKLGEFRRVGHGIGRLTLVAPPLAWGLGALAAHHLAGLSWPVSAVLGAILVVTGPTVILPLLKQARLNKQSASLLKWEGIVNDPIGVLLAVLTFQYLTLGGTGLGDTLRGLGAAIAAAAVLGAGGGWATALLFRRGAVPESLKPTLLMVLVLLVYAASNRVQHEAGLLSVTAMGLVLGNVRLVERASLQAFKAHLTVLLLSVLFIVIPAQLDGSQLALLGWREGLFVLAILFLVRPLSILLSTLGAPMRRQDQWLLAWIAPRGIVAAATAGIFGPALVAAGYPDAAKLLPLTFLVIMATVLAHGLSIGWLARRLGLAAKSENGLLLIGASPWSLALAQSLKQLKVDVLMVDGTYQHLKDARMRGVEVYYGEILSEHAEHTLEIEHLSHVLCATDNDFYNALVCKALGADFGNHRTFQLATHQASGQKFKRLTLQQRGYFSFDPVASFDWLQQRLDAGWTVQTTRFSASYGWREFSERMGRAGEDWLLLGGLTPAGQLRLDSAEQGVKLASGWTALYFAPEGAAPAPAPVPPAPVEPSA